MSARSGKPYVVAWIALVVLTGASFGLSYLPLGAASPLLALGIALGKALVVIFVFMHLREALFAARMVVLLNFLFVALICLGVYADVAFR